MHACKQLTITRYYLSKTNANELPADSTELLESKHPRVPSSDPIDHPFVPSGLLRETKCREYSKTAKKNIYNEHDTNPISIQNDRSFRKSIIFHTWHRQQVLYVTFGNQY